MKYSLNWLKDYVDIDKKNAKELAEKITEAGVAIERIEKLCDVEGLIVGQIKEVTNHPNSDKLHVCMVDTGKETLQIICGAPNVKENIKIILSPVGTTLPGDFKIKKATIREVESNGMICALEEIGIPKEFLSEEELSGIHILKSSAKVGENALDYIDYDDIIYSPDLNPNRSDCLSMLGFAYEVASVSELEVKLPENKINAIEEKTSEYINLNVKTENCPYYTTRIVKDVVIKESPDFIKARLISAGMRPINNVVDISNYVMLEYGQPLHFFDLDKLNKEINVRMAKKGEECISLDNKKRVLKDTDVVITNNEEIVAIAGVMGCKNSEVTENTKNILIESAIFNPYNIRYTSIRLDLRSEASIRFEKGLDPNKTEEALNRAAYLLELYADAKILSEIVKHDNIDKENKIISVSSEKINGVLGTDISSDKIESIFKQLGFKVKDNKFTVEVPTRRQDIEIAEDLIEEVGRIYGFHNIEGKFPEGVLKAGKSSDSYKVRKEIRKRLEALGFYEMRTFSLVEKKESSLFTNSKEEKINVLMPMSSEKETLRQSIIPSLLEVVDYNLARNTKDILIYEVSSVYSKVEEEYKEEWKVAGAMLGSYMNDVLNNKNIKVDFYVLKGVIENILDYLGLKNRYTFSDSDIPKEFHPGISASIKIGKNIIGYIGKVHPSIKKEEVYTFELSISKILEQKVRIIKYKEPTKYPEVTRDISIVIDKTVKAEEIIKTIKKGAGPILSDINIFDVYKGSKLSDDKKSIALTLTFSDDNKTLTEAEVKEVFDLIIDKLSKELKAELRS